MADQGNTIAIVFVDRFSQFPSSLLAQLSIHTYTTLLSSSFYQTLHLNTVLLHAMPSAPTTLKHSLR